MLRAYLIIFIIIHQMDPSERVDMHYAYPTHSVGAKWWIDLKVGHDPSVTEVSFDYREPKGRLTSWSYRPVGGPGDALKKGSSKRLAS